MCMPDKPVVWGTRWAITSQELELDGYDYIRLDYDLDLDAYVFAIKREGTQEDLLRSLDRFIWALQVARKRAAGKPAVA